MCQKTQLNIKCGPVNDFGNLDYKEFLRRYSSQRNDLKLNSQRPVSTMSGVRAPSRAMSRSMTQVKTKTQSFERYTLPLYMYMTITADKMK
jgi:hypothetical protein